MARAADIARMRSEEGDRTGAELGGEREGENRNGNGENGEIGEAAGMGFAGRTVDAGRRSGSLGEERKGERVREMESQRSKARMESGYEDGCIFMYNYLGALNLIV